MMIAVTKDYFKMDGSQIYYEIAGQGESLVLSHAGFVDSRMWDDQFTAFARHFRVVRYDLRGFGKSSALEQPINRRGDLYSLLQHLGIQDAVLVGCSMSGEIVLDLALEHPEMVRALVLVSAVPGGFEMQGEAPAQLMEMIAAMQQNDLERALELQMRLWVEGAFRTPAQVDSRIRQAAAEMARIPLANGTFLKADMELVQPLVPPAAQRLHELQVPVLTTAGALDHPEVLRAADVMEKEIPHARKVILPDCAHLPNMEKPAEFNQVVLDFLAAK